MPLFGATVPFADHCGIEGVEAGDGVVRLRVADAPHLGNNIGMMHGGLTCTLLDIALASAARTKLNTPMMTVDLQFAFIGPARGTLLAEGRIVRAGRQIVFCEGEARREEDGALVAKATGVFMPVRPKEAKPAPAGDQNSV